jgi:prevent-host-death family protein
MRQVGVRELKNRATQIVRAVREAHEEYIITVAGEPVAVLRPVTQEEIATAKDRDLEEWWRKWDEVAGKIAASRQNERTAQELVSEQRR